MLAQTIDEVIGQLNDIIARARVERSRLGYFATLYRNVTVRVKQGIGEGLFEDGARMERLDVTFANRYLAAYESFRRGERPSRCWLVSFEAAAQRPPIILQHLLLGMNAHINLDLGFAAAATSPGGELPSLRRDFDTINGLLAGMLERVKQNVEEVSPWIKFADAISDKRAEDALINFSLRKARDAAWRVATRLAPLTTAEQQPELDRIDLEVALLGRLVRHPVGLIINSGLRLIRLRESNDIPHVLDVLAQA